MRVKVWFKDGRYTEKLVSSFAEIPYEISEIRKIEILGVWS